jgi:uncharacterized membrane protein YccC
VNDTAAHASAPTESALVALAREARALSFHGPRAQQATITAASVVLSVVTALALHLPDAWWAAISGFMSTQATRPESLRKALLRIISTVIGALAAYLLVGWLAYDHAACYLAFAVAGFLAVYGMAVSPHGYAWLFSGITFTLVVLMSLTDPSQAFSLAVNRTLEVGIGTGSAVLLALLLAPKGDKAALATTPGWRDPFGANWPITMNAIRSGIGVAIIPLIWSLFDLPGLATMATTVVLVLAAPQPANHASGHLARILERSVYRLLGCLVGGVAGLALVALPLTEFLPWLVALWIGTWLFAWMQGSSSGAGYVGTQAGMVFIMTLVQDFGPPDSILPGINRFAGILIGVSAMLPVTLLIPAPDD